MYTQLLIEVAIIVAVAIVALPLVGQALAMVLGVLVTLRSRGGVAAGRDSRTLPGVVESRLRRAVMTLGSRLDVNETAGCSCQRTNTDARSIPDRRSGERRLRARRWHARKDYERRYRERRVHSQRRRNR